MTRRVLLILIAPILLAACGTAGSASHGPSNAPAATAAATPNATIAATPSATTAATPTPIRVASSVLVTANASLGSILASPQGRTLYYFVPEKGGTLVCLGQCTTFWPPLLTSTMAPTADMGLPGHLSVISRGGSEQVTYNRWPLYTFAGDSAAGQTNGQGVVGFGGKWFVATPNLQP